MLHVLVALALTFGAQAAVSAAVAAPASSSGAAPPRMETSPQLKGFQPCMEAEPCSVMDLPSMPAADAGISGGGVVLMLVVVVAEIARRYRSAHGVARHCTRRLVLLPLPCRVGVLPVMALAALPVALAQSATAALFDPIVAAQRSSNLSFHWESPSDLRRNWASYARARSQCTWTPSEDTPVLDVEGSQDEYNKHLLRYVPFPFCNPLCTLGRPRASSIKCRVAAPLANGESATTPTSNATSFWHVQRIGPVRSHGGNNFIIIRATDALDLSSELARHGGALSVTAIFLGVVDTSVGRVLGYPPIHIHHSHLGPHSMIGILDFVAPLHFPHGETSCRPEDGGDACYMFSFPPAHGFRMTEPFLLNAMINDVRASGAPPLDVTLEIGLRITSADAHQRNVGLWYVGADSDTNAFAMLLLHRQSFYTFTVPFNDESALWSTFKPTRSGRLLNIWHHTHVTEGFDSMWLIDATPPQLGLEEAGDGIFELPGCNAPFVPSAHGLSNDAVRSRILKRMRAMRLGFRCVWRRPNVVWVDSVTGIDGVEPGLYARQTEVQCFEGSDRIEAGAYMTFVAFFDTKKLCEHCGAAGGPGIAFYQGEGVQQHMHFQARLKSCSAQTRSRGSFPALPLPPCRPPSNAQREARLTPLAAFITVCDHRATSCTMTAPQRSATSLRTASTRTSGPPTRFARTPSTAPLPPSSRPPSPARGSCRAARSRATRRGASLRARGSLALGECS